jgi:hypothetical protein
MKARISAAAEARQDADFVVIARCDEFYHVGGGGTGSLDEAVRRGVAYAAAGADVFLPTMAPDEQIPLISAQVPIPVAGFGKLVKGMAFSLFTGWGTSSAARAHQEWATYLWQHGELPHDAFGIPGKDDLIDQGLYDQVVATWATRTGRPVRPVGG